MGASGGASRRLSRDFGRSGPGTLPTTNLSEVTVTPRAASCEMICGASNDSSCAQVAVVARTQRTPDSSLTGSARAATRVPTAPSHVAAAITGAPAEAGREAGWRPSTSPSISGCRARRDMGAS